MQSVGRERQQGHQFYLPAEQPGGMPERRAGGESSDAIGYSCIEVDDHVAKISLVGAGMMTHVGVASDMFEALYDAGINIQMIATSEIRISVSGEQRPMQTARMKVVHDKFFGIED